jgi:ubiquinone/menaquinone biosynthesis C-methylase UbiE
MMLSLPQLDCYVRLGGQTFLRSLPTYATPYRPKRRGVCTATGSATPTPTPMQEPAPPSNANANANAKYTLACPICQTTQFEITKRNGKVDIGGSNLPNCPRCQRQYAMKTRYVDLTLTSGVTPRAYKQRSWNGTELFRNPLVSVAYERGWRQSFAWAGFPGVDAEAKMAIDFLSPAHGEVIIDMSCGSGLFSRRFLSSGKFAGVIAADFSESMLEEAYRNFTTVTTTTTTRRSGLDGDLDQNSYLLLRADVARLPFTTGSVAGIHAGAALHCWPNPAMALAEISRILKPGGVFVASTFLTGTAALGQLLGNDDLVRPLRGIESVVGSSNAYRWWEEDEIRDLCDVAGLQSFKRERKNRFIMFCVSKPLFNSGDA